MEVTYPKIALVGVHGSLSKNSHATFAEDCNFLWSSMVILFHIDECATG